MVIDLFIADDEIEWLIDAWDEKKYGPINRTDYPSYRLQKRIYDLVFPYDAQWRRLVGMSNG